MSPDGNRIRRLLSPGANRGARRGSRRWSGCCGVDAVHAIRVLVGSRYGRRAHRDCHGAKQQPADYSETYSHDSVFHATPKTNLTVKNSPDWSSKTLLILVKTGAGVVFETELQIDRSLATHVIDSYWSSEVRTHPRVRYRPLRLFALPGVRVRFDHLPASRPKARSDGESFPCAFKSACHLRRAKAYMDIRLCPTPK